jgi:hypothetical protein
VALPVHDRFPAPTSPATLSLCSAAAVLNICSVRETGRRKFGRIGMMLIACA